MKSTDLFNRLALRFQSHTNCTEKKAQQHTKNYLWQCGLMMAAHHFHQQSGSNYYIDQTHLQNYLNTLMVQGQRHYVWQIFQSFPERVFDIIRTGSNLREEMTLARPNHDLETVILASGTPEQLWEELYKPYAQEIQRGEYDTIKIDLDSLKNYIRHNLAQPRNGIDSQHNLETQLDNNLHHAQRILMLAQAGNGEMIHIHSPSVFGRRYYQGPNLQNIPKIVRLAALGDCHQYDIESSVFAWKLSWFRDICHHAQEKIPMPATLEYIDHKKAIRRRLARDVFDTCDEWAVKITKEFITAIGFGAPIRSKGYVDEKGLYKKPALNTIIRSRERLDRALNDKWVMEFIDEQQKINRVIMGFGEIMGDDRAWHEIPDLQDKMGRLLPNSVIAYLYQQAERRILDWLERFCADKEILLTVHDCIYTRQPVDLRELRMGIREFGEYFNVEHQAQQAWQDHSDHEQFLAEHQAHIQQEEAHAAAVFGHHTLPKKNIINKKSKEKKSPDGGGYNGSGWDGSGSNYSAWDDPAVDDPDAYHHWRQQQIESPKKVDKTP